MNTIAANGKQIKGKVTLACGLGSLALWLIAMGCSIQWATVRVRNLTSETLTDVRLVGVEPVVAFGYCSPDADKSTSLAETMAFTRDVAIEYRRNGELCRQPLNRKGDFPARLENRNKIIELQFTTNLVWTWTVKEGHVVK